MKEIIVMTAKPNTLGTFEMLMLLGHELTERSGFEYNVECDFKNDCVYLKKVENTTCDPLCDLMNQLTEAIK